MEKIKNVGNKVEKFMYGNEEYELKPGDTLESPVPNFFNWLIDKLGYVSGPGCPLHLTVIPDEPPAKLPDLKIRGKRVKE